jgi:fucose 4-O-acetylase-like acetyltransferase
MIRDPWLDNVKMTLVTLVVVGHSLGLLGATWLDGQLYNWLYVWHIPAFVLVTGHLSRSFAWDRRHLSSLVTTVVLPYLVFEWALFTWRDHLGQHEQGPLWLQPHWGMWYLCVLFFWRLATPVLRRHWLWIPASVGISLAGGLVDELWFGLPRILGLLPFFVLGLHLDRTLLRRLSASWLKPLAVGVLVGIWVFAASIDAWARTAFLYYDAGYEALGFQPGEAAEIRLGVMVAGLAGTLAVLALVPRHGGWFSRLGASTLVVYLFHGFVVRYAQYRGTFDWAPEHDLLALAVVTALAVALAFLLAAPPVATRLNWLVDPVGSWRRGRLPLPRGARRMAGQRQDDAGDSRRDRALPSASPR